MIELLVISAAALLLSGRAQAKEQAREKALTPAGPPQAAQGAPAAPRKKAPVFVPGPGWSWDGNKWSPPAAVDPGEDPGHGPSDPPGGARPIEDFPVDGPPPGGPIYIRNPDGGNQIVIIDDPGLWWDIIRTWDPFYLWLWIARYHPDWIHILP